MVKDTLEKLLTTYTKAFDAMDAKAMVAQYVLPCAVSDGDGKQLFNDPDVLLNKFEAICKSMKKMAYQYSEFNILDKIPMGNDAMTGNVEWRVRLVDSHIDFRCLYICHLVEGEWKIFCANVYQGGFD